MHSGYSKSYIVFIQYIEYISILNIKAYLTQICVGNIIVLSWYEWGFDKLFYNYESLHHFYW